MKYIIASDLHGSEVYCRKLIEALKRERADKLLLLGDLLYHGPRNPLPEGYDPQAVASLLNAHKQQILCVRGNCDSEVDQMLLEFPILAEYCILSVGNRMMFATHGHRYNEQHLPMLQQGDVLLHGHTHVPALADRGAYLFANPGSLALPKEESESSYLVLDNHTLSLQTLSGEVVEVLTL